MNRSQRSSDQKDGKISRDEDDPDVIITVTNRRAHDAHNPNAGRGGIAGCDIALSDDGAHPNEADANDDALQDVRLTWRAGPEDGDPWTRPQLAIATSGKVRRPALRSARARFQPIGTARMNATARWTRWSRLSVQTPSVGQCAIHTEAS